MPSAFTNRALLVLGHGSSQNPDSSRSTRDAVIAIARAGVFGSVHCAFLKEKPDFQEVWQQIEEDRVYLVPNFVSEGFFTREVIPGKLGLSGRTTRRGIHLVHYCEPVGLHPGMTQLILNRATEATDTPPGEVSLLLVGHGTARNAMSREAIQDQVRKIRQSGIPFAEVMPVFLEEPPLLADWKSLTSTPHVVVVPFFMAEGLHTQNDIPEILGLERLSSSSGGIISQKIGGRTVRCTSPVGTDPAIPRMILEQATRFKERGDG